MSLSGKTVFSASCIARSEGYFPSEVTSGHFSDRSDVYSFGVVCNDVLIDVHDVNPHPLHCSFEIYYFM